MEEDAEVQIEQWAEASAQQDVRDLDALLRVPELSVAAAPGDVVLRRKRAVLALLATDAVFAVTERLCEHAQLAAAAQSDSVQVSNGVGGAAAAAAAAATATAGAVPQQLLRLMTVALEVWPILLDAARQAARPEQDRTDRTSLEPWSEPQLNLALRTLSQLHAGCCAVFSLFLCSIGAANSSHERRTLVERNGADGKREHSHGMLLIDFATKGLQSMCDLVLADDTCDIEPQFFGVLYPCAALLIGTALRYLARQGADAFTYGTTFPQLARALRALTVCVRTDSENQMQPDDHARQSVLRLCLQTLTLVSGRTRFYALKFESLEGASLSHPCSTVADILHLFNDSVAHGRRTRSRHPQIEWIHCATMCCELVYCWSGAASGWPLSIMQANIPTPLGRAIDAVYQLCLANQSARVSNSGVSLLTQRAFRAVSSVLDACRGERKQQVRQELDMDRFVWYLNNRPPRWNECPGVFAEFYIGLLDSLFCFMLGFPPSVDRFAEWEGPEHLCTFLDESKAWFYPYADSNALQALQLVIAFANCVRISCFQCPAATPYFITKRGVLPLFGRVIETAVEKTPGMGATEEEEQINACCRIFEALSNLVFGVASVKVLVGDENGFLERALTVLTRYSSLSVSAPPSESRVALALQLVRAACYFVCNVIMQAEELLPLVIRTDCVSEVLGALTPLILEHWQIAQLYVRFISNGAVTFGYDFVLELDAWCVGSYIAQSMRNHFHDGLDVLREGFDCITILVVAEPELYREEFATKWQVLELIELTLAKYANISLLVHSVSCAILVLCEAMKDEEDSDILSCNRRALIRMGVHSRLREIMNSESEHPETRLHARCAWLALCRHDSHDNDHDRQSSEGQDMGTGTVLQHRAVPDEATGATRSLIRRSTGSLQTIRSAPLIASLSSESKAPWVPVQETRAREPWTPAGLYESASPNLRIPQVDSASRPKPALDIPEHSASESQKPSLASAVRRINMLNTLMPKRPDHTVTTNPLNLIFPSMGSKRPPPPPSPE
ncbi:hypothetical protein FVE85_2275 [Porphyridium purpureum]|uniref:Uncharacterized protein n=1 Tax=Porphyridium purpureum TaxID=35688 RepID=A0A5J4YYR4_PORPP|nr:hypothetical protein FVE85_2275 [Porphyridium purpureum]|eukprot:POR0015..scf209_3